RIPRHHPRSTLFPYTTLFRSRLRNQPNRTRKRNQRTTPKRPPNQTHNRQPSNTTHQNTHPRREKQRPNRKNRKHRIRRRSSTSSTPLAKSLQLPPSTQKPTHTTSNRTPQPDRRTKRRLGQSA